MAARLGGGARGEPDNYLGKQPHHPSPLHPHPAIARAPLRVTNL